MGNNENQLIELMKTFREIVKDLTMTMGTLPQSISNLSNIVSKQTAEMSNLSKSSELASLQKDFNIYKLEVLSKLQRVEDVYNTICKVNNDLTNKTASEIELKKLELQETEIKETNTTKRSILEFLGKILAFLLAGGTGAFAVVKYIIPLLSSADKVVK